MAVKTQTIEYAFTSRPGSLGDASYLEFAPLTVYIPQTTDRTFKSVMAILSFTDECTATGQTIDAWRVALDIAGSDWHEIDDESGGSQVFLSHTADNYDVGIIAGDWAADFNDHFGNGTSAVVKARVYADYTTGTGLSSNNVCLTLIITFEASDAAATKIKTVRIPLESPTTVLTNSLAEIGTNQVPALDTFLPEANKTYRDIFFECWTNQDNGDSTDYALALALDDENEAQTDVIETALVTSTNFHYIWKRTDMSTDSAHAFKARSTVASRFHCLAVQLVVTYEYSEANTTKVINSKILPFTPMGNVPRRDDDAERCMLDFWITEPGDITLVQSAVWFMYSMSDGANVNLYIRCGAQNYRGYVTAVTNTSAAAKQIQHRIDSGGAQGAAIKLARGLNSLAVDTYDAITTASNLHNPNGYAIINYTSDKTEQSGGTSNHSRPILWYLRKNAAPGLVVFAQWAGGAAFSETHYLIDGAGLMEIKNQGGNHASWNVGVAYVAGEGPGAGWVQLYGDRWSGSTETGTHWRRIAMQHVFKRWPGDPDPRRMDLKTTRPWRWYNGSLTVESGFMITFNLSNIMYAVAGTVSGYTGDGSGLTVDIHDAVTHERVLTTETAEGGVYSVNWVDDARELYAHCRQSDTLCGRSTNGTAAIPV